MNFRKLIMEDVRCFAGRQEFKIRPITFLVGENSTGKSTALGCFQILADFINDWRFGRSFDLDFNVEPYQMGAFADIVRRANPAKKGFQIGLEFQMDGQKETIEYLLTLAEKERGSEPIVQQERFVVTAGEIVLEFDESDGNSNSPSRFRGFEVVDILQEDKKKTFVVNSSRQNTSAFFWLSHLDYFFKERGRERLSSKDKEFYRFVKKHLFQSLSRRNRRPYMSDVSSFAPIRSKPQRTYNPLKEDVSPEGSDMPMLLMNMSKADKKTWLELKKRLVEFGKTSGLFTDINVRRLGKSMGDPFQLQIKVKGPKANLIDVGYGVTQVLPILVRIFNAHSRTTFLMQQPEVHLHPKGQAELSSLMVDIVKQREHAFVVETHSDCMINRARIEIMNRKIKPEDVSLIYLEPVGNKVKTHNIRFDVQANMLDTPNGYREFFLKESNKLLGIEY